MKKKKRGIRRASAVIAFILLTSIAFLSAVFTLEMIDSQIYRNSQEETDHDITIKLVKGICGCRCNTR